MILLLLAALQAANPAVPPPPGRAPNDIVVTGVPLSKLKQALQDCLARKCLPREDINRTLAYAEGQFVAGDYEGSRSTLNAARHRNGRFAAALPLDVADLHRAAGRISGLSGRVGGEQSATFDMIDALKAGVSKGDERVLMARLELGQAYARAGQFNDALERYGTVKRQARRLSLRRVEGMALFQEAVLLSAVARSYPPYRDNAKAAVRQIQQTSDPEMALFRNAVRLIDVQLLANPQKRTAAMEAALAHMEPVATNRPMLLYSPRVELSTNDFGAAHGSDTEWADIGFVVAQDGTVKNVETLSTSKNLVPHWLAMVTRSVEQRRYMPMSLPEEAPEKHRVERYSFVSDRVLEKYSPRMHVRSAKRRIVPTDLTPDSEAEPPKS